MPGIGHLQAMYVIQVITSIFKPSKGLSIEFVVLQNDISSLQHFHQAWA